MKNHKKHLESWKPIWNCEKPWKLNWSCTGWLWVVTGGYRRLQGGSDDFSWQTDTQTLIIIYISSQVWQYYNLPHDKIQNTKYKTSPPWCCRFGNITSCPRRSRGCQGSRIRCVMSSLELVGSRISNVIFLVILGVWQYQKAKFQKQSRLGVSKN